MPSRDADGFGTVQFRDRRTSATTEPHSLLAIGSTIFLAVLLALCVHDLIRLAVISAAARNFTQQMESEIKRLNAELERQSSTSLTPVYHPPAPRAQQQVAPRYVGPIEAKASGSDTACMAGRTAVRIPDGWRTTNQACIATTPVSPVQSSSRTDMPLRGVGAKVTPAPARSLPAIRQPAQGPCSGVMLCTTRA